MATKISLRKKKISNSRRSLYLDFYPEILNPTTGKLTRREFLGLYIETRPKTEVEKRTNRETLQLAESIRAKRQLEFQAEDYGFLESKIKQTKDFVGFFEQLIDGKYGSNKRNWIISLKYLKEFSGDNLPMKKLNETYCNNFKNYLINAKRLRGDSEEVIKLSSASDSFKKFKAALRQAFKAGLLNRDLASLIDNISVPETHREYLNIEELQKLVSTPCNIQVLKNAALFSAITGLRFSDIEKLVWGEVQYSENGGHFLQFRQKKTKGAEVLPISEQAFTLLGERKSSLSQVFDGLKYSNIMNEHLKNWLNEAGIEKHITFHSFRHTFATLQLSLGTDIYTVSKMLGHKDLKTTQIYAKIIDQTKREAANKIKLEL
jgi:integrase